MLKDKRKELIKHVRDNQQYLSHNYEIYDIYRGNLLPYVVAILESTLSKNYFDKIKSRVIPINILERYIKKVACAYENPPKRIANKPGYQEVVDYYVKEMSINHKGQIADQYSHLFKGYAWEPYINEDKPSLRVLPYDRFIPYSDNQVDPTEETIFVKIMGKKKIGDREVAIYYSFSETEFDAFTSEGETYLPAFEGNDGVNLYQTIPFVYGKRAENELMPVQDTDILAMSKLVSVLLSDISGAAMFQCFSIIYGIDLDMENAVMSPNALWSFKSDANSEKKPEVGTIKPEADIDKIMSFIVSVFVMWLETKGVRVGSVGNVDAGNMASGISKIIDEMDVYKVVKESVQAFQYDEQEFWKKMINIHNEWLVTGQVKGLPMLGDDFEIQIIFPEPQPKRAKKDLIEEKKMEVDAGFKSKRRAIMELNPDMSEQELELELAEINGEESVEVVVDAESI